MSDSEKLAAARDVHELIESCGQEAVLLRKQTGEQLYGSDDESFAEVRSFKLEFVCTPPEDITNKIDAAASVLPDLDINSEDRVQTVDDIYRVQTVVDQMLFGVVTHKTLKLVRLHGC
jgi:hypothetical protein